MDKLFCVYIMANGHNTVLYVGMSSDLKGRVWQHKNGIVDGFSKRYKTTKLVYYEVCPGAEGAIVREKQLKGGSQRRRSPSSSRLIPPGAISTKTFNQRVPSLRGALRATQQSL